MFIAAYSIVKFTIYCVRLLYNRVCIVPLGTVGNRFTRLKATKHACNRAEVKIVKELGGTDFYFCTLVALSDIKRYFEKYEDNKEKVKKCESIQGLGENETKKKEKRISSKGDTRKKSISKSLLSEGNSLNITKTQVHNDSQELSTVDTNTSFSPEDNTPTTGKKRKRRTQFEMLQVYQFYTDVTENENHKRKRTSLSDDDCQQFEADTMMSVDINSNIIEDQSKSPEKLQESMFDYDKLDLPCSDDNNNASGSIEPRSPTLLLKRSQNNKWHVAKSVLPQFDLDAIESEKPSNMTIKPTSNKSSERSKTAITKVKNKIKGLRKSSKTTSKEPSAKKAKLNKSVNPLVSLKKLGKKGIKKVKKSTVKRKNPAGTVEKQKQANKLDENSKSVSVLTENNPENSGTTSVSVQLNIDARKGSLPPNDTTDSLNMTPIENKEKRENSTKIEATVVKKKRKRRVEMNSFRLIETIPYSSLLVVKDGDLSPSFTMAYNQEKNVPGCCHSLWRWRLGKPLRIPSQSPLKPKEDQYLLEKTQDDLSPDTTTTIDKFSLCFETKQNENSRLEKSPEDFPVEKRPNDHVLIQKGPNEQLLVEAKSKQLLAVVHLPIDKIKEGQTPVEKRLSEQATEKSMTGDQSTIKEITVDQFPLNEMTDEQFLVKVMQNGQLSVKKKEDDQFPIEQMQDIPVKEKPATCLPIEIKPVEQLPVEKIPNEELSVEKRPNKECSHVKELDELHQDERKMAGTFKATTTRDENSPDDVEKEYQFVFEEKQDNSSVEAQQSNI